MSPDPQDGTPSVTRPGSAFVHGTVEAGGYTLDYASAGPQHPEAVIVSLPGSAGLEMSTAKDRLVTRYRVVEINPPGWGARDDVVTRMHQSQLGPFLAEAIKQLVDGPFYLIGTSMGGSNALYVAAALPDRVRGIVLEGGMAPSRPEDLRMPPPPEPGPTPGRRPPTRSRPSTRASRGRRRSTWRSRWRCGCGCSAGSNRTCRRPRRSQRSGSTGSQCWPCWGRPTRSWPPTQELRFRAELPDADFRFVPEGGHDLQNTVPTAFVDLVEEFIASTASS